MILGGILIISGQIFLGVVKQSPGLAAIIAFFGMIICLTGYVIWKWENAWIGRRSTGPDRERGTFRDNRAVAIIPPPLKLPAFDPDTGRRLCSFFFYDVDNRLPCLSGCEYPQSKHGTCTRELSIPTCPYPVSREPIIKSLMTKPVAWCPGPGGCKHFNEQEYACGLKLKGVPTQVLYTYNRKSHNERIGLIIVAIGAAPILLQVLTAFIDFGLEVSPALPVVGVFIGVIGAVISSHAE